MSQKILKDNQGADILSRNKTGRKTGKRSRSPSGSPSSYLPSGVHGRIRGQLIVAQRVLAEDVELLLSEVSLSALLEGVSRFLGESRAAGALSEASTSRLGPGFTPEGRSGRKRPRKAETFDQYQERVAREETRLDRIQRRIGGE